MTATETAAIYLVAYTIENKAIKVGEAGQQISPETVQMQVFICTCSSFDIFSLFFYFYFFFNFTKHNRSLLNEFWTRMLSRFQNIVSTHRNRDLDPRVTEH